MRWLLLLAFIPNLAYACVCGAWPSAKDALEDSPVVFLGHVVRTEPDSRYDDRWQYQAQTAWVTVDEPFKGATKDQSFTLKQPAFDCAPKFKQDEKVLLYLHRASGHDAWVAWGCHRSRLVDDAANDLLFLRALPASAIGNRLSGTVALEARSASGVLGFRGLAGIHVRVTGNGHSSDLLTNTKGVYEIYGLPSGDYRVAIESPPGMRVSFPTITGPRRPFLHGSDPVLVHMESHSEAEIGFVLVYDNLMAGHVFGPNGKPMKDVCLQAKPADGPTPQYFYVADCSKADGSYTMRDMPPGQYRIVANANGEASKAEPFPRLYYPGAIDIANAKVVTIGAGEHIAGLDLRVPALSKPELLLEGRVEFSDGAVFANEEVTFAAKDGSYKASGRTGRDGTFRFKIFGGKSGELRGSLFAPHRIIRECPQLAKFAPVDGYFLTAFGDPIAIPGDTDQVGLVLKMPFPSCKSSRKQ